MPDYSDYLNAYQPRLMPQDTGAPPGRMPSSPSCPARPRAWAAAARYARRLEARRFRGLGARPLGGQRSGGWE